MCPCAFTVGSILCKYAIGRRRQSVPALRVEQKQAAQQPRRWEVRGLAHEMLVQRGDGDQVRHTPDKLLLLLDPAFNYQGRQTAGNALIYQCVVQMNPQTKTITLSS